MIYRECCYKITAESTKKGTVITVNAYKPVSVIVIFTEETELAQTIYINE